MNTLHRVAHDDEQAGPIVLSELPECSHEFVSGSVAHWAAANAPPRCRDAARRGARKSPCRRASLGAPVPRKSRMLCPIARSSETVTFGMFSSTRIFIRLGPRHPAVSPAPPRVKRVVEAHQNVRWQCNRGHIAHPIRQSDSGQLTKRWNHFCTYARTDPFSHCDPFSHWFGCLQSPGSAIRPGRSVRRPAGQRRVRGFEKWEVPRDGPAQRPRARRPRMRPRRSRSPGVKILAQNGSILGGGRIRGTGAAKYSVSTLWDGY